ncbi:MAG: hypothetical protein V7603_6217 [Micromonosporaceae bacterium]
MMDLDTLRSGLRAAPGQPLGAVDIEHVMARGRRLRVRRRLLASGGAAALAAAVLAASAGSSWLAQPRPAVPGGTAPPSSAAPSLAAPSWAAQGQDPVGAVVPTGIRLRGGEVVLYAVAVGEPSVPGVHFGVMAGQMDADGRLTARVASNEVTGSDRAAGFHAVQAATEVDGVWMPEFGYYAGPAAKISGSVGGQVIRARQARWSQDPGVVLFWFDPADLPAGKQPSRLSAFDAAGRALPTGDATAGHG